MKCSHLPIVNIVFINFMVWKSNDKQSMISNDYIKHSKIVGVFKVEFKK